MQMPDKDIILPRLHALQPYDSLTWSGATLFRTQFSCLIPVILVSQPVVMPNPRHAVYQHHQEQTVQSVTAVDGGFITSPSVPEFVLQTFSGKVGNPTQRGHVTGGTMGFHRPVETSSELTPPRKHTGQSRHGRSARHIDVMPVSGAAGAARDLSFDVYLLAGTKQSGRT